MTADVRAPAEESLRTGPVPPRVIVVMGVSGAGKTTVGTALAAALGWPYLEGDEYHSAANIAKMASGHALTDADRAPWLATLRSVIAGVLCDGSHAVLACSALRASYRTALTPADAPPGAVRFVYLDVPEAVLRERVAHRHHFMPPELLGSQLAVLEPPDKHELTLDGTRTPGELVQEIRRAFGI